ncbi:hypothetical protein LPJ61_004169 [Coemansia biformis]|uniref:Ribosomal protein S2 n=1 Tax=Coemansia biformis TaxID=1286918 RepID=A0A9W7YB61_9FUNG|nr:hypothetical protein LPJ61_004169 [Coemansia biformis]
MATEKSGPNKTPRVSEAQRREMMREHLHRLTPKLEAMGSRQTEEARGPAMMEHTSANLTLEAMLAAGMHLGHSASLWNRMNLPFIFGERDGIHIINLEHTMAALRRAAAFVKNVAYNGGIVVFVGTRKEHRQLAVDAALHAEQYFVTGKWVPGTLTNPRPLLGKHFTYANDVWDVPEARDFAEHQAPPSAGASEKKGGGSTRYMQMLEQEKAKALARGDGLKMYKPDLIVALNPRESKTMLTEARLSFVPTVGIIDTNCDPRLVSYPIPCNDDSLRAVMIVAGVLARAARDGMDLRRGRLLAAVSQHNKEYIERESARSRRFPDDSASDDQ